MARLIALAVFDKASGGYGHPFFVAALGQAMRMFFDWCEDKTSVLGKHSSDFELYSVGFFDDQEPGLISAPSVLVARGSDLVGPTGPEKPVRLRSIEEVKR